MTPEQQVQDLHEAIASGRATLALFTPQVLPRWTPPKVYPLPDPPGGVWISAEDLQPADFLPGDYARAAAAIFCGCGEESGTVTQVSKDGTVIGGMKCRRCDFFAPILKLEGWDPSWALQFKMLREYAATRLEQQLETQWASHHARMVGDWVRARGVIGFAGLTLVVALSSLAGFFIGVGVAVVKRSRCLVGEHNPVEGFRDTFGMGLSPIVFLSSEPRPSSAVKVTCCEVCRKELP